MLSPEFKSAISTANLLRTRIMLKDSLIVDPTFTQFKEMYNYAKRALPEILVPFDNGPMEDNRERWDKDLMNTELVELVNNFSEERIEHLKKVIGVVLSDRIGAVKAVKPSRPVPADYSSSDERMNNSSMAKAEERDGEQKKAEMERALRHLTESIMKIEGIMKIVRSRDERIYSWKDCEISEVEKAAKEILKETKNYRKNK